MYNQVTEKLITKMIEGEESGSSGKSFLLIADDKKTEN